MDEIKKKIDEGWKENVEKEKAKKSANQEAKFTPPEPNFNFFITTLALQASISVGEIANPATNKKEEDLTQTKFLIDTLDMLKEKTKGNLSAEETGLLENLIYELKMQYVAKSRAAPQQ